MRQWRKAQIDRLITDVVELGHSVSNLEEANESRWVHDTKCMCCNKKTLVVEKDLGVWERTYRYRIHCTSCGFSQKHNKYHSLKQCVANLPFNNGVEDDV